MAQIKSLRQVNRYNVNRPGFETVTQPVYDFQTYPAAGTPSLIFFQNPQGQGGRTQQDTFMTTAGVLAQPQTFIARSIEVQFFSGVLVSPAEDVAAPFAASQGINDVMAVMRTGWLKFFIGSKPYLEFGPLMNFPPENGLGGFAAMSATDAAAGSYNVTQYARPVGKCFALKYPIRLEANQNFSVSLNFNAAVALPSGVDGRIGVVLRGDLIRKSQ